MRAVCRRFSSLRIPIIMCRLCVCVTHWMGCRVNLLWRFACFFVLRLKWKPQNGIDWNVWRWVSKTIIIMFVVRRIVAPISRFSWIRQATHRNTKFAFRQKINIYRRSANRSFPSNVNVRIQNMFLRKVSRPRTPKPDCSVVSERACRTCVCVYEWMRQREWERVREWMHELPGHVWFSLCLWVGTIYFRWEFLFS